MIIWNIVKIENKNEVVYIHTFSLLFFLEKQFKRLTSYHFIVLHHCDL